MSKARRTYLPAAGRDWLLPLYDPLVRLLGIDADRRMLVDQSDIQPGHRVLDIGCGTGTMAVLIKRLHPSVEVTGLDPDPKALTRARRKAEQANVSVQFDWGFSDELPYPESSFDRVFSSFMFHHLELGEKEKTLHEIQRVLTPGGAFHLLDFGHSDPEEVRDGSFLSRWIHARHQLKDNSENRILALISQAGFADSEKVAQRTRFFGRIVCYRAFTP